MSSCTMSGVFENGDNNLSDDSLASDDERIINKKLTADVWEFFQKIQDEESGLITNYKCILCAKLYSPGNPTSFNNPSNISSIRKGIFNFRINYFKN